MRPDSQQEAQMNAEGSDVCASLAANPKHGKVAFIVELDELTLVDGADAQLALNGGYERWALEQSARQGFESASELGFAAGQLVMQTNNTDILLASALLGFDEPGGSINANYETAGDFGI
jgi:hypothetical protein